MNEDLEPLPPSQLGARDYKVVSAKTVWSGFFKLLDIAVKHKKFDGSWTQLLSREQLDKGCGAAAIVYDPDTNAIGLVEQFRIGACESTHGPWCLEVVAGMIEHQETPEQVIRRELYEEAGIEGATLIPITNYYSTPGGCTEKIHLFCAICSLNGKQGVYGLQEESEDIYFHVIDADTVFASMYTSRVNNAATLIALQWLKANRGTL